MGELGNFYGGLTGKSKKDFEQGNAKYITYMNVFTNIATDLDSENWVKVGDEERQNKIAYKDILFTGSSETPNECGMTSVVNQPIAEDIYLNSFCFGFRFDSEFIDIFDPDFLKYLFRGNLLRREITRTANGVTRFNISKKKMEKIKIPIPPLSVQKEIARILDALTALTSELTSELTLRQKQYQYYRDKLLTFGDEVEWKTLGEVCDYVDYRGKTPKKVDRGVYLITAKNIKKGFIDYEVSKEYVSEEEYLEIMRRGLPKVGDVLITTEAPCGNVAQIDNEYIALAQRVIKYRTKNSLILSNSFIKFFLLGNQFQNDLMKIATGGTVKGVKGSLLHKLKIPIPSIEEQKRIVEILDKFDMLTNSISKGLPKEIELRNKQYEYYREMLLGFERV